MAEMCKFVSKDGKGKLAYTCGLIAQEGSLYCPRHTFLHNISPQSAERKEREMWRNPQGNRVPFNPMPEYNSYVQSHFATCTRASDFRRTG